MIPEITEKGKSPPSHWDGDGGVDIGKKTEREKDGRNWSRHLSETVLLMFVPRWLHRRDFPFPAHSIYKDISTKQNPTLRICNDMPRDRTLKKGNKSFESSPVENVCRVFVAGLKKDTV